MGANSFLTRTYKIAIPVLSAATIIWSLHHIASAKRELTIIGDLLQYEANQNMAREEQFKEIIGKLSVYLSEREKAARRKRRSSVIKPNTPFSKPRQHMSTPPSSVKRAGLSRSVSEAANHLSVSRARIEDAFQWEMGAVNAPQFTKMISLLNGKETGGAPVYFDVGTNVGVFPVRIGNACSKCSIHGFEPVKAYFEFASAKTAGNPNVKINNVAASDVTGTSTIMVSDGGGNEKNANLGWNSLLAEKTSEQGGVMHEEVIQTLALDEYVSTHSITCVDAVKIDTEGFEARVISGFLKSLRKMFLAGCAPVLFVEVGWGTAPGTRNDYKIEQDMFRMLESLGYSLPPNVNDIRGTSDVVMYPMSHNKPSIIL
jgi:FkbM family methyltransferase